MKMNHAYHKKETWQLSHVTPEMNQGKLNHYYSSDCMTMVPLSAAVTVLLHQ
jgi:hypothetical protein